MWNVKHTHTHASALFLSFMSKQTHARHTHKHTRHIHMRKIIKKPVSLDLSLQYDHKTNAT